MWQGLPYRGTGYTNSMSTSAALKNATGSKNTEEMTQSDMQYLRIFPITNRKLEATDILAKKKKHKNTQKMILNYLVISA